MLSQLTRAQLSPVLACATLLVALAIFWADGLIHMATVWALSPTYTHGFLVAPVSAGLIWLGRTTLPLRPWWTALKGVAPAAALYALGHIREIHLLQHAGIAAGIVAVLAGTLGRDFASRHRFALGFLLFLVPVGEGLVPLLQLITAKGMMLAAAMFDVIAVRHGTVIMTDAGDFLVEEGCSGLRFLTASVVTGVLGAHLFFSTKWKQIAFVVAAITIPILTNIIRASTILIVGTWTDMRVATGFDHVVYGWGLFSIIMVVLVGLAIFFAENDAPRRPVPICGGGTEGVQLLPFSAAIVTIVISGII